MYSKLPFQLNKEKEKKQNNEIYENFNSEKKYQISAHNI